MVSFRMDGAWSLIKCRVKYFSKESATDICQRGKTRGLISLWNINSLVWRVSNIQVSSSCGLADYKYLDDTRQCFAYIILQFHIVNRLRGWCKWEKCYECYMICELQYNLNNKTSEMKAVPLMVVISCRLIFLTWKKNANEYL